MTTESSLRDALAELVACEGLRLSAISLRSDPYYITQADIAETQYEQSIESAWANARAALAASPSPQAVPDGWQPIETAPQDKTLLFWWQPVNENPHAMTCVIGQVSSYEPGFWWNSQRAAHQAIWHVTHWMPLPAAPQPAEPTPKP